MKTTIVTIAIALSTVFGISQTTYAATKNEEGIVLTEVTDVNKIEVHGNVELYVTSGNEDKVKVYNKYYEENAVIRDEHGVLCITSYNTEKLVVWVTVSNLSELAAFDNAEVKSFGKFSAIDLNVALFNKATANLDMDAYTANITLNDHAKAELTGTITEGSIKYNSGFTELNTSALASVKMTKTDLAEGPAVEEIADLF